MDVGRLAKYQQIAGDLTGRITRGDLQPGDPLPSEDTLAERWGVARMTARKALQELERAGLVVSAGRLGRTVGRRDLLTVHVTRTADYTWGGEGETRGADAWVGDTHRAGHEPTQQIEVLTQLAEREVARRLEVAEGTVVTTRRLLRGAAGVPHNQITFTFPHDIAEGTILASPASIREGSIAWLDRTQGPLTHEVELWPRMPTTAEQALLRIPAWVPVQLVWRVSRTPHRPVMTSCAVYPGDRARLRLSL